RPGEGGDVSLAGHAGMEVVDGTDVGRRKLELRITGPAVVEAVASVLGADRAQDVVERDLLRITGGARRVGAPGRQVALADAERAPRVDRAAVAAEQRVALAQAGQAGQVHYGVRLGLEGVSECGDTLGLAGAVAGPRRGVR